MRTLVLTLAIGLLAPGLAAAQELTEARQLYNRAEYGEVVRKVAESEAPPDERSRLIFLQSQAFQRLDERDGVMQAYGMLASGEFGEPWRLVGESAQLLAQGNADGALERARQAVEVAPNLAEAHFQLGSVYAHRNDFQPASAAYQRATQLDPADAYAHYYAGLAFSRIRRVDQTANHFEAFLKLAPEAPERPEVMSIMRTLRGR